MVLSHHLPFCMPWGCLVQSFASQRIFFRARLDRIQFSRVLEIRVHDFGISDLPLLWSFLFHEPVKARRVRFCLVPEGPF